MDKLMYCGWRRVRGKRDTSDEKGEVRSRRTSEVERGRKARHLESFLIFNLVKDTGLLIASYSP